MKLCSQYTEETISRYVDRELPSDEMAAVTDHLADCRACRRQVETLRMVTDIFDSRTDRIVADQPPVPVPAPGPSFRERLTEWLTAAFGRHRYLKLASLAVVALVTTLAVFQGISDPPGQAGPGPAGTGLHDPSAIVKSVDTDYSSVMILETEGRQHTIIWLSET